MTAAMPCPVCAGPIGIHVVRPEFTCHHCGWVLRANVGDAFRRATVVGVAAVLIALGLLLLLPFPTASVVDVWLRGGAGLGMIFATITYRTTLALTPARPLRAKARRSV
ncbi:MAG: hypothetical protein V4858_20850 [Pseudomonadota bacterium]